MNTSLSVFEGLTAWFSSSVRKERLLLWEKYGGAITTFDKAQFLFSESANSPDTKAIFDSEAYLKEHIAVFHSMYINTCKEAGDRKDVKIGDYFLPPTDIQNMVKKQFSYKWQLDTNVSKSENGLNAAEDSYEQGRQQQVQVQPSTQFEKEHLSHQHQQASTSTEDELIDIVELQKYNGLLREFKPGMKGFEVISV